GPDGPKVVHNTSSDTPRERSDQCPTRGKAGSAWRANGCPGDSRRKEGRKNRSRSRRFEAGARSAKALPKGARIAAANPAPRRRHEGLGRGKGKHSTLKKSVGSSKAVCQWSVLGNHCSPFHAPCLLLVPTLGVGTHVRTLCGPSSSPPRNCPP